MDFMFQLTKKEMMEVVTNCDHLSGYGFLINFLILSPNKA